MLWLIDQQAELPKHILSGKFFQTQPFLHTKRQMDCFDIMVGLQGKLYITQEDKPLVLEPDHFLLLRPDVKHYGHIESPAPLSYYYSHFQLRNEVNFIEDQESHQLTSQCQSPQDAYIIPEYGKIYNTDRICQLFAQLVDYGAQNTQNKCSDKVMDRLLSVLLMELSQQALQSLEAEKSGTCTKCSRGMNEIINYIQMNSDQGLAVSEIASQFNYNAEYLTTYFRKVTGSPLLTYIHKTQLAKAKPMLLNSSMKIKDVAYAVGFQDEKCFMKVFKKYEDLTPSQYRNAFANAFLSNK
jgi:AraC-like DNA-binding protein